MMIIEKTKYYLNTYKHKRYGIVVEDISTYPKESSLNFNTLEDLYKYVKTKKYYCGVTVKDFNSFIKKFWR